MSNLAHMRSEALPTFFSSQVFEARRFALQAVRGSKLRVISAGRERTGRGYLIDRQSFPYIGIEFVAAGHGELWLAGVRYELGAGSFFVYDRRTPHRITADEHLPMVKYFVDLEGVGARRLLRESTVTAGAVGRSGLPDRVVALFDELIRAGLDGGAYAHETCRALTEAIVWRLADRATGGAMAGSSEAFENYLRCRRELEKSASLVRSLGELSHRCGVTASYMCRLFKQFDSTTPYRLLVRHRASCAAAMLREGRSVGEVSDELGYQNPFHFSRQFKSVFGVPPSRVGRST